MNHGPMGGHETKPENLVDQRRGTTIDGLSQHCARAAYEVPCWLVCRALPNWLGSRGAARNRRSPLARLAYIASRSSEGLVLAPGGAGGRGCRSRGSGSSR